MLQEDVFAIGLPLKTCQEQVRVPALAWTNHTFWVSRHLLIVDKSQLVKWAKIETSRDNLCIWTIVSLDQVLDHDGVTHG